MTLSDYMRMSPNGKIHASVRIPYANKQDFLKAARFFDIMEDFKDGVARTAYSGVVQIYFAQQIVYIAPAQKLAWSGYDTKW